MQKCMKASTTFLQTGWFVSGSEHWSSSACNEPISGTTLSIAYVHIARVRLDNSTEHICT